jgi:hypothetical protein
LKLVLVLNVDLGKMFNVEFMQYIWKTVQGEMLLIPNMKQHLIIVVQVTVTSGSEPETTMSPKMRHRHRRKKNKKKNKSENEGKKELSGDSGGEMPSSTVSTSMPQVCVSFVDVFLTV